LVVMGVIVGNGIFSLTNPGGRRRLGFGGKNMSRKQVSSRREIGFLPQSILTLTLFKKRNQNSILGTEIITFY
ncbi:hypothetical protein, partial [Leptospira weilii]|uniref:hypothetical protein n=1 Tax=Leptospira weilii TaxID=28184 RepID=UPI001F1AFA9F